MKYLHEFDTINNYNEMRFGEEYEEPWVSLTNENSKVNYNITEEEREKEREELLNTPLTFTITNAGNIIWKQGKSGNTKNVIEYSKNKGVWTPITANTDNITTSEISVVPGDIIQFRGNNNTYSASVNDFDTFSGSTAQFKIKGNIMSLIDSTNFSGTTTLEIDNTFSQIFRNCTGLTSASQLLLPATTLTKACYYGMFRYCTNLITAPELPATILTERCYEYMFQGCTKLNYIKCLATNISAGYCTYNWVSGVASSGTFVKAASITSWSTGVDGIPTGWTRINA